MIGSNLRTLKFDGSSYFMKTGLCSNCGQGYECNVREDDVQACQAYMPVIMFKSFAGMDTQFNTFRLGSAWKNRVYPGKIVALVDADGNKVCEAVVEAVRAGDRQQMILEHSDQNHLIIARNSRNPAKDMAKILRNLYGPNFLARAEQITVLYLRRIESDPIVIYRGST